METKQEIVKKYLEAFGDGKSIDSLQDIVIVNMIDDIVPPDYGGALTIYDESNDEERVQLIKDIKKVLESDATIEYQMVWNEGEETESNSEVFEFTQRHSVWYKLIFHQSTNS